MHKFRFFGLALHLLAGLFTVLCVWPFLKRSARIHSVQRFSKKLLRIVNVRVRSTGAAFAHHGPFLLYCNHVSWLDIFVINSVHPVIFIAKSELASWPVAGTTGTGRAPMHFHSNFVQAAIQASTPVLPVSLQFFDAQGQFTEQPAFVGEQTLMDNVRVLLNRREGFEVRLTFHSPLNVEGLTRHELSQHAHAHIAQCLSEGRMGGSRSV